MIATPWNLILTVLFVATGVWCAIDLMRHRGKARHGAAAGISLHTVVDVNHLVMSAAMILMVWVSVVDAFTWAQIAVFVIFIVALVPGLVSEDSRAARISTVAHIALNAAMVWMLAAMPLLMAGMHSDIGDGSGHHHGGVGMDMLMATPGWADLVNIVFVGLSAAAALWWAVRLVAARGRNFHDGCYVLMGAGMAIMLVVMNA